MGNFIYGPVVVPSNGATATCMSSSGKYRGSKVPKQINRRARDAMMIAAVHHVALVPKSKAYFDRKRAEGKSHQQAVRAIARILAKVLYAMLKQGVDYKRPADPVLLPPVSIA